MLYVGVDEAGRGPVLGPLVIACVATDVEGLVKLRKLGVKDSKALSPSKRGEIYESLKKLNVTIKSVAIMPDQIDRFMLKGNLNFLEAYWVAYILKDLDFEIAFVDSPPGALKFQNTIARYMKSNKRVLAFPEADRILPIVSAASIVAKVERDKFFEKIREITGTGYPSDPKTREFLLKMLDKKEYRKLIRWSWKTIKKIREESL